MTMFLINYGIINACRMKKGNKEVASVRSKSLVKSN